MNNALLLSLGHNSSAIFTDGVKHIGYEQERLDRVKSSSAPPILAIQEIEDNTEVPFGTPIFVTHWFDQFGGIPENKYTANLSNYASVSKSEFITHEKDFTHHDAHAHSVYSFFKHYVKKLPENVQQTTEKFYCLVVDGFGNFQETLSLYILEPAPRLIHRVYGYKNSLGLMYQYATKFCGMKMNQDEYKFLGYESKVEYLFSLEQIELLKLRAGSQVHRMLRNFKSQTEVPVSVRCLLDYKSLADAENFWDMQLDSVIHSLGITDRMSNKSRVAVGFYIQTILESVLTEFCEDYDVENLLVAGGVFYNVKLNHALLKSISGLFSAVPLAGDQGASIGFYDRWVGEFNWDTLCIGKRRKFDKAGLANAKNSLSNVYTPETEEELQILVSDKIIRGEICNLVTDKMEYGPRALGSTSSLFLATKELSIVNNRLNKRNEVMPFAPMIRSDQMESQFEDDYKRVVGSDRFMIVTYDYKQPPCGWNEGVYHKYPLKSNQFSGRPQVIHPENSLIFNLLRQIGSPLITNTSYNYHGEPIVFSMEDILHTHERQLENYAFHQGELPPVNLILWKTKE